MLEQVRNEELELFVSASGDERPADEDEVSLTALVPAFVLSELKTAFIIGFIVFIPFLVIDIVVSSSLMSMRSEEHTSELQSLMRISYAVFCLKKKKPTK